jgi:DNA modification methylase
VNTFRNSLAWQVVPLSDLKPYSRHARRHARAKIEKLKKLLCHFGQVVPIIVDASNRVIDGHALLIAMRELGAGEINVITVEGRSDSDIKALRLALNRLPAEAAWDNELLRADLQELIQASFDLELTGFDTPEIDHILEVDIAQRNLAEDGSDIPPVAEHAISTKGDIWLCDRHRVGCGDALDQQFVDAICGGTKCDLSIIDPPYNLPVDGFVSGNGKIRHREFVQASGEMSSEEFQAFLKAALAVLQAASNPSALAFVFMDWRHLYELIGASRELSLELANLVVWTKTNAGLGSFYRSQHEHIAIFRAGGAPHANNIQLGRLGRNRSNVWTYSGFNAFGRDRNLLLPAHPTVKPVLLVADALRDVTKRGDIVLDTFLGSGSTLIAAEETGRTCYAGEIDPLYVDLAIRRWQAKTCCDATHAVTGGRFNERASAYELARANDHDR